MAAENHSEQQQSEIREFYVGKTIFVTGASGFIGKLIVEKLLRSCWDIKQIYMLLREKKGKNPNDRFNEMFDIPAFDNLKTERPNFLTKLRILEGDLALPNLGLSEIHQIIIREEVNCIFHVGATVRFDEKLRTATYINIRSPRDLLRLAKDMKHLESFVHVSTAYSNCTRAVIDEKFYKPIISGEKLLNLVECLDDEILDQITPTLLQDNPNTYVFTKVIAEDIVRTESDKLPVAIVRPSIVIATFEEPTPGWLDNLYGPTTIFLGAALGLIRTLHARKDVNADLVPADFVSNHIIATAWDVAKNGWNLVDDQSMKDESKEPKIYNYVSSPQNPITWGTYLDYTYEYARQIPSPLIIWHATFDIHSNYYVHCIIAFLLQTIPAYIVDFFAKLLGKKPMFVDAFRKINKFCGVISYFTMSQWTFKNANTQELCKKLNPSDRKLFNFDITSMTWRQYFPRYMKGARIFLLKDPMDTIPQGKRKLLYVKVGHYMLVTVICFLFYKLFMLLWSLF